MLGFLYDVSKKNISVYCVSKDMVNKKVCAFIMLLLFSLWYRWWCGKCLFTRSMKFLAKCGVTFWLNVGVKPYNVAFAVPQFLMWHGVLHVMSVTTIFKGIFIDVFLPC